MVGTEHLRERGVSYKELEAQGIYLAVTAVRVRYRQPARYDDLVRVRCWVRERASRRIIFGYALDVPERNELVATAETAMLVLGPDFAWARLPSEVLRLLAREADPVRLF